MKTKRKAKPFDCVAFKRKAQARIYQKTKGLSPEEEIVCLEARAEKGPLGNWWKRIKSIKTHKPSRRRTL